MSAPDDASGATALLKGDHLQRTGSFKLRGAWNAVALLAADARARGVVTASSGNFAQALAFSARLAGVPATILMPADAPPEKSSSPRSHGADIVLYDRYDDDREARGAALVAPPAARSSTRTTTSTSWPGRAQRRSS